MLVKTFGGAVQGIHAHTITIEVHVGLGAKFILVGLPDNAVKESQQRINAALKNISFKIPRKGVIINMAPADIKKEGASYDLALAIGILAADEKISSNALSQYIIMGELSLDGSVKPIKGILPICLKAREDGFKGVILPYDNQMEASILDQLNIVPVKHITDVIDFLNHAKINYPPSRSQEIFIPISNTQELDFSDVKGQDNIKRALEIAAAGGHNVLLIGPPGAGKTMLAKRIPGILPPLSSEEALEATKIHSVAGRLGSGGVLKNRPFRSPHHTISDIALVGGGTYPMPGEISLAHHGVLFLDELPEFKRGVLEVLRQPLEERMIRISRAKFTTEFPAGFMLIASMNPCPCGYYNHPDKECICSSNMVRKYLQKISGPLLDRIDLHIEVTPVAVNDFMRKSTAETSQSIRQRVLEAQKRQKTRFKSLNIYQNAQMSARNIQSYCSLEESCAELLKSAIERFKLSARAYDRIIKVARTIADLDQQEHIQNRHIAEAIQYRSLDKEKWIK